MFRSTGANAFAKNQMRLAYEDKRDLYMYKLIDPHIMIYLFTRTTVIAPNAFAITEKQNDTDIIQIGNNIVDAEILINTLL